MRDKISNVFRAFGSSLFGSAARIMFWNSAGTRARVWKIDAMRGRGQRCGRIARETASAVTRCCSNLARLADPIITLTITHDELLISVSACTENCQCDNFQCSHGWKYCQNYNIFVSVTMWFQRHMARRCWRLKGTPPPLYPSERLGHFISNATVNVSWWRHQMETFSALLVFCAGNSLVTGEFPAQRPVTRSFGVFFDLCLNK